MPTKRIGSRLGKAARSLLLPLGGFLLLSAGFLWEPLLTGKVFLPSDLAFRYDHLWAARGQGRPADQVASNPILADVSDYYHPYRVFASDELHRGRLPLWNPYILTGTPFFASTQAALLEPVNFLVSPMDALASWTWGAWLRLGLLGFFTFGFARSLGRSALAAAAAGIVFMLSGFVVVWLNYPVVWTLVWMPALFWASTRLIETGARRHLLGVALSIGALLVGGHPETQFLVGLAWGPYGLVALSLLPAPRSRVVRSRLARLAGGVALGAALGAVQWLPFVDFLFRSHAFEARAEPFAAFDALESGLRLAVLFLPNLAGERYERDYWLPRSVTNNNEQTGYVGLLALALAVLGLRAAWRRGGPEARRAAFFAAAALVAVALAIRAPGFHWIKLVPLLDVGHGVRWLLVSSFCAALLAASGVDSLRAAPAAALERAGRVMATLTLAGLVVLLGLWVYFHGLAETRPFALVLRGETSFVRAGTLATVFDPLRLSVHPPLLFLGAGAALLLATARGVLRPAAGALGVVGLLYLDLCVFGSRYNPVTPAADVFPPTPTTRFLEQQLGHERIAAGGHLLRPNVSMLFGFRDLRGYEDVVDRDFAALYGDSFARLEALAWVKRELTEADVRLFDVAAVRYFLTAAPPLAPRPLPHRLALHSEGIFTYESPTAVPRAHAVLSARVVPDASAARAALLGPGLDPLREVVLVGGGTPLQGPSLDVPAVAWRADEAGVVALEATLPAPGYVVLADLWSADWQASLDGEPAPLLRANGVFRAVAVPAGTHEVRFRYRPRLVYASAGVSALAAALVALAALPGRRRKVPDARPARAARDAT